MIFRFRVCRDNDDADTAQGWVVAPSEHCAIGLVGPHSFLQRMPCQSDMGIPLGTIVVTEGNLDEQFGP